MRRRRPVISTALVLLLAASWLVCARYELGWDIGKVLICVEGGAIGIIVGRESQRRSIVSSQDVGAFAYLMPHLSRSSLGTVCLVPIWMMFGPLALWCGFRWRRALQRDPANSCSRCGYDLTGNVSGRCPECGAAAPVAVTIESPRV